MRDRDPPTEVTRILWTGGWDSTYRLLELLLIEQRQVQPYYLLDRLRGSVAAERAAMQRIRALLAERHPNAARGLRETIEVEVTDVAPDAELSRHYGRCLRHAFIGGQYEWLARFCAEHGIDDMELAIHEDDKARGLLAGLVDSSRRALDARFAGDSRYELFRFFRFPLFDTTKREMRSRARAAGFEEAMRLTWFCHEPRRGAPCGTCNPCIYTIEEGLGDRIPLAGRIRYALRIVPRLKNWVKSHPGLYVRLRGMLRRQRQTAA